uniref:ribosomal protein S11 n=1 Tax=Gephyrocapsa ericsonii TaxID=1856766 RepID=UPI002027A9C5|nr:ribosomal protein S11 [Gephyrocapsa ericsonii]UPY84566.1 ribosomal protein S11 [Gephyrocapsa ericsonii]
MIKQVKRFTSKKSKKTVNAGIVNIKSTFNNTIVNITDKQGNTLFWASAGGCGFKGAKKSTPFAAQSAAEKVGSMAVEQGMKQAEVIISGPGNGRETAIRALQSCGLEVLLIKDITPVPHNGCRPPKKRRV